MKEDVNGYLQVISMARNLTVVKLTQNVGIVFRCMEQPSKYCKNDSLFIPF